MKRVLVTGAAGFIGSHLTDALLARGDEVLGLDEFNDYYDPAVKRGNLAGALAKPGFALVEADICDEAALRAAFERFRPEVVVHLAARAGVRPSLQDPNLYHRVNVVGGQHILDACRDFGPSHLVFASSSSVYGGSTAVPFTEDDPVMRPISPYAATKRMNELQAHVYSHLYGLNVTMLRFFTVYGPRQRPDMAIHKFTRNLLRGEPIPVFGDGSTRRDYTYIDDIVQGLLGCVDTPLRYEILNLGYGHPYAMTEFVQIMEELTGRAALVRDVPGPASEPAITFANNHKARELIGFDPQVPLPEGLARTWAWYRKKHGL